VVAPWFRVFDHERRLVYSQLPMSAWPPGAAEKRTFQNSRLVPLTDTACHVG
jgi:hypothetical protein